jgi:hypothetical protein
MTTEEEVNKMSCSYFYQNKYQNYLLAPNVDNQRCPERKDYQGKGGITERSRARAEGYGA